MKKQVFEYILRLFLFIILTGMLHTKISTPIMYGMESFFEFFYGKKPIFNFDIDIELLFGILIGLFSLFMSCIGVTYLFAKICGIFKKLDNLKKWQGILVIILITIFSYQIAEIYDKYRLPYFYIIGEIGFANLFLVPSYLFYLHLNHLTNKYPKPFKKIGYYCSVEFFKDLINKLFNKYNKIKKAKDDGGF